jgi:hypothetical protein
MCLSNVGLNIAAVVATSGLNGGSLFVKTVSFFINFYILASLFWSVAITNTMALVIIQREKLLTLLSNNGIPSSRLAVKRMMKFQVIIVGSAFVLSLIPALVDSYADSAANWYWYKPDGKSQLVALFCYYLPLAGGRCGHFSVDIFVYVLYYE